MFHILSPRRMTFRKTGLTSVFKVVAQISIQPSKMGCKDRVFSLKVLGLSEKILLVTYHWSLVIGH